MREAYKRCEEFLDLEKREAKSIFERQREELQKAVAKANPEQVQKVLAVLGSAMPSSEGNHV